MFAMVVKVRLPPHFLTGRYNNSSLSVDPGGGSISGMFVSYVRIIQNFVCLSVGYLYISLLKVG